MQTIRVAAGMSVWQGGKQLESNGGGRRWQVAKKITAACLLLRPHLLNPFKVWPRLPAVDLKAPVGQEEHQKAKKQKLLDLLDGQPVFLPGIKMVAACCLVCSDC